MFLLCPRERALQISHIGREAINRKYRQRRRKSQKERNQIMAEEIRNQESEQAQETTQNQQEQMQENNEVSTPSIEEVMARAAQAEADAKKWKNEFDKQSSQIATLKKTVHSLQTAEQRKESEDQEAKEAHDAEFARLQEFERRSLAKERYLMQGMDTETATKAADAEVTGDMDKLAEIQKQHTESTLKAARAEWQGSQRQPQFDTGEYSSMTVEEAMKIPDREKRLKALAQITR